MDVEQRESRAAEVAGVTTVKQIHWQHRFGQMLIELRSDGSVAIDGKVVADTQPPAAARQENAHG